MKSYEIQNMVIDNDFYSEESITAEFTYNHNMYSVTFNKADLELINSWVFENGSSLPANLSDTIIESVREDVKKRI